jgi:hypothetical protein
MIGRRNLPSAMAETVWGLEVAVAVLGRPSLQVFRNFSKEIDRTLGKM